MSKSSTKIKQYQPENLKVQIVRKDGKFVKVFPWTLHGIKAPGLPKPNSARF